MQVSGGFLRELGPHMCLKEFFFLKKNHIIKVIYVSYKKQPQDKMKLPSLHSHFQFALKQFALHCPQIF